MLSFISSILPSQFPNLQKEKSNHFILILFSTSHMSNPVGCILKIFPESLFSSLPPNPNPHEFLVLYWKMLLTGLSASIPAPKIYHPVCEFLLKDKSCLTPLKTLQHLSSDPWQSWVILWLRFLAHYHRLSLQPLWSVLTGLHQSPSCSWEHWVCFFFLLRAFCFHCPFCAEYCFSR